MNRTNPSLFLVSVIFILTAGILCAQERPVPGEGPRRGEGQGFRRQLVLDINTRVLEGSRVTWNETRQERTAPGTPVNVQLSGSNVAVVVQFTPFLRRDEGNVLVAQAQIYITNPDHGVNYYTSMQTIPMEFNEPIYFYPLGRSGGSSTSSIEIIITVSRYRETETTND